MLRIVFSVLCLLAVSGIPLLLGGCSENEVCPCENSNSVTISAPKIGDTLVEWTTTHIYWNHDGSAGSFRIELLRGAEVVGDVVAEIVSWGHYEWTVDALGETSGSDFYIRVSRIGDSEDFGTVGPLTIETGVSPDAIAFALAHYSDERLVQAYTSSTVNPYPNEAAYWLERRVGFVGIGGGFFRDDTGNAIIINSINELHNLPLYVTEEDDQQQYYKNLGKWDQFVFGWDDFKRPAGVDKVPPNYALSDLSQPAVSSNRETFRAMAGIDVGGD